MENSQVVLSKEESTLVVEVLEALLRVIKREQFFAWLQGNFQSLIPHEVLICGHGIKNRSEVHFDSFSSTRYLTEHHVKQVTNPENGLVTRVINAWKKSYCPILVSHDFSVKNLGFYHVPFEENESVLRALELKNLIAHGVYNKEGDLLTFFSFSRIAGGPNAKHAHILELIVPHMHQALLRVLGGTQMNLAASVEAVNEKQLISSREIEVLSWVYSGKTNPEISIILEISVNTVKNHVHKAIAKLGVENRLQAASKANKLGLIG